MFENKYYLKEIHSSEFNFKSNFGGRHNNIEMFALRLQPLL